MILQRDPRLRPEIQEFGCYLMSLLWWGNKLVNAQLSAESINDVIYPHCVSEGLMGAECYILSPDGILEYLGVNARYHGQHDAPTRVCGEHEIECLLWHYPPRDLYHFTAGDGFGNVTYDPYGVSLAATHGRLKSKRIFTVLDREVF